MTKSECKKFLRMCKSLDFVKINPFLKKYNISHSAVSKFINYDEYDDFISLKKLQMICEEIYNSCGFVVDMYSDICKNVE